MARRKKKTRASKLNTEYNPTAGGNSRYARKKLWLALHPMKIAAGRDFVTLKAKFTLVELFGFQVPHPKPWA